MLDDELTLLDGTEVISATEVIKITNDHPDAADLLTRLTPAAILNGTRYFDKVEVASLVAGSR